MKLNSFKAHRTRAPYWKLCLLCRQFHPLEFMMCTHLISICCVPKNERTHKLDRVDASISLHYITPIASTIDANALHSKACKAFHIISV